MYPFDYHRPADLAAIQNVLAEKGEAARPVAGGMSLLPMMKHRLAAPSDLVDLSLVAELKQVSVSGNAVVIGAATTHAEVAASPDVAGAIPALAVLAGGIGDPLVRNRGTIGGSLAHADPAACYPAGVLGLDATIVTTEREVAAGDFFIGPFETVLAPGEVITAVRFPFPGTAEYVKFANPASRFSIVGIFLARFDGDVRVAVTGAGDHAFRATALERALTADFRPSAIEAAIVDPHGLLSDIHGSAEYRAHLIRVLTQTAVENCLAR